ncbi:M50 family metallopeptidase [Gallaecimonas sp. GXIMD1310]|uniref:M50 family metallopeptidase n=1 Tax=Gallaecimonas sp. GXIMD1310 TaxID=3131926 RepID=UPI00324E8044
MIRVILVLLLAVVVSSVPYLNIPFLWFTTLFHESGHALTTVLSGGQVHKLVLRMNGSGYCLSQGGVAWLIALAGYPAASLCGAVLLRASSRRQRRPLPWLLLMAWTLLAMLLWARDPLTILLMLLCLPLLWLGGRQPPLGLLLAALLIVNALLSPFNLLFREPGDSLILSTMTGLPAWLYVLLWLLVGLLSLQWALKGVKR